MAAQRFGDTARRLAGGVKPEHVVEILMTQGLGKDEAVAIVAKVRQGFAQAMAAASIRRIRTGFFWLAGGAVITVATYSLAHYRAVFVVAFGPVFWGLVRIVGGLVDWLRFRNV